AAPAAGVPSRMPPAGTQTHPGPAAILPLGDGPLECVVFDRMVFHMDRKALLTGNEAWPARDGPPLHPPAKLQPQVIMQTPRRVLLDDELMAFASMDAPPRLRGQIELAFPAIYLKAHAQLACLHCAEAYPKWMRFCVVTPGNAAAARDWSDSSRQPCCQVARRAMRQLAPCQR